MNYQFWDGMLNDPSTKQGRWFMLFVNSLIIVSMVEYSLSTVPQFNSKYQSILNAFELSIVAIFSVEYVLRVYFARRKGKFIFSLYGIVDFLSFAPYYFFLFTGVDTRSLRVARTFRLLRLFKLFRYSKSIERLKVAYKHIKDELVLFGAASGILLFLSGVGIYHFENEKQPEVFVSVFDGLWWAVVTLTTVGYGDVIPVTPEGKVFTFIVVVIGLGIIAVPTGLMVSGLQEARRQIK